MFLVFFLILVANPCFWVNNWGWYVNMRSLSKIGKMKTSKMSVNWPKLGINS